MKIKVTGLGRNVAVRQHNCIAAGGTKAVFPFMQPQKSRHGKPAIIGFELCLIGLSPLLHRLLIGRSFHSAKTDAGCQQQTSEVSARERAHASYFFSSAPASRSDLGSDKFLGEAFCNVFTINRPAAGVPTLWPITTSRAETFLP